MADKEEAKAKEQKLQSGEGEERMLQQKNISLILDSYDDLFSDFDPRPFSSRALSDDFLTECRKATHDKKNSEEMALRLMAPADKRDLAEEAKIKKRLKDHFQKHFKEKQDEQKEVMLHGILLFVVGAVLSFIAVLIYEKQNIIYTILIVLFEPAGWFTMWTGLEKIFRESIDKKAELDFYRKMAGMKIYFYSY